MSEILIPLFVLLIPVYWLWRMTVATNARIALMEELNSFLNPEKGNSEMTMRIAYKAYEDVKKHFFIVELALFVLFKVNKTDFKLRAEEFKRLPEAERKKMSELVGKFLMANIKLSPITYLVVGVLVLLATFFAALINYLSPKRISQGLQNLKERALYSIYSF